MNVGSGGFLFSRARVPLLVPRLPDTVKIVPYLRRIDAERWYSNFGPLWWEFREALEARLYVQTGASEIHVAFTTSGTCAIELALRCRALRGRRYCLMPSFTFVATAHAVCNAQLIPYLVDVDPRSFVLTPDIARRALRRLPEQPAAVLVVSAFGAPPDILGWQAFERDEGIPVVFDAAGATTSLDRIGAQPVAISLHATKTLGIGEGGAVISANPALIERITAMTAFGCFSGSRTSEVRGGNYHISEYAAAIGLAALGGLDDKISKLRDVTMQYRERLANSSLELQDGIGERWVSGTLNVLMPEDRLAGALGRFDSAGVEWRRWWGLGCHTHPAFESAPALELPITTDVAPRLIGVPCHTELDPAQIDVVCDLLLSPKMA
jgi:dTDP-4-amino-4,6-dideoxygalactose transaminase